MKFLQRSILIFFIALCGSASAQTTVCGGDSVVLALNGYKHGSTLWQQSSDQMTWSKASGTAYNDSLIVTATTFYYRAIVTDGTCSPFYSDTVQVVVNHPIPPTAKPASEITFISFIANWDAVEGATTYYIDVATDAGFTSFVGGYQNLQVNNKQITYTVIGVQCNTTYYYRVRVYDDACGIVSDNSNTITVTTPTCPVYCTYKSACDGNITDARDNQTYRTVQIGTQCWMAQNLNMGTMIQGALPQTPGIDNQDTSIEKYCYDDMGGNCTMYGGLYLWNEMMAYDTNANRIVAPGPQGICPTGWHIPTDNEWKCLEMNIGMSATDVDAYCERGNIEGGKLKDASSLWLPPNAYATNSSGFTALPAGKRVNIYNRAGDDLCNAHYYYLEWWFELGRSGYWWSATKYDAITQIYREVNYSAGGVKRNNSGRDVFGLSVRCVKN